MENLELRRSTRDTFCDETPEPTRVRAAGGRPQCCSGRVYPGPKILATPDVGLRSITKRGRRGKVNLVRSQSGGPTNRFYTRQCHVGQHDTPVVLPLVDGHTQHLSHGVVGSFGSSIGLRVIGARGGFPNVHEVNYRAYRRRWAWSGIPTGSCSGWLTKMVAVPLAVNSAEVVANMSARRLKRSMNSRM